MPCCHPSSRSRCTDDDEREAGGALREQQPDFTRLSAVILNCTLKRADTESHTGKLLSVPAEIMRWNRVAVEEIRPVTMPIAFGVQPDMTEHGWPEDAWPQLQQKIANAEILIVGTPIWGGKLGLPAYNRVALRNVGHTEQLRAERLLRQGRRRRDWNVFPVPCMTCSISTAHTSRRRCSIT